jgi:transposase
MTSASKTKLFTELLNLESVQVTSYQNLPQIGLILHIQPKSKEATMRSLLYIQVKKYIKTIDNECNLNEKQKEKLKEVKAVSTMLAKMHELKEKLREIFEEKESGLSGLIKISDWLKEAQAYYPESQKTIVRWIGEIISYFDERITNGVVEGINNKLKLIKRSAYGFRNFQNFRIRVLLSCGV